VIVERLERFRRLRHEGKDSSDAHSCAYEEQTGPLLRVLKWRWHSLPVEIDNSFGAPAIRNPHRNPNAEKDNKEKQKKIHQIQDCGNLLPLLREQGIEARNNIEAL
jgi:hypothetical protein